MEARESNEHIDLMRLIVMQLISAPAPVMKMKGLQLSEINWDLPPPHYTSFFVSAPSVWTRIRRVWQTEEQRRFLFVSLHLSAFIPFPNIVITAASGTFTHEGPLSQLDSGGQCGGGVKAPDPRYELPCITTRALHFHNCRQGDCRAK